MPKYWGKQIFTHGPEVGQKQKTERKEREKSTVKKITAALDAYPDLSG